MIKILCVIMLIAIYIFFSDCINYVFKDVFYQIKNTFTFLENTKSKKYISKIFMVISKDKNETRDEKIFYFITIGIFVISLYALISVFKYNAVTSGLALRSNEIIIAVIFSIIMALIPYIYIRTKLTLMQRSGSFEGETLLKELFTQYKIADGNIITTITETVKELTSEQPVTKRALFRLSLRITSIKTEEEMKESIEDFVYAINTNWAKSLGNDFYSAIWEKVDIYAGIEGLLEDCKIINANLEADKRGNLESAAMINLLAPIFIFLFGKMAIETIPIKKLLYYQFYTDTGVKMFCLIIISIALTSIVVKLLTKPKYDL